jgi:5S rRNA maturation endonuclease (ribonuclease M5)
MGDKLDKKTKAAIEEIVERKLIEILGDPDYGLELRKEVKERVKQSLKEGGKGIPAATVAKKLGLKW